MNLRPNQIIYTELGYAQVKTVRSLNQTLQKLEELRNPTKTHKIRKKHSICMVKSSQSKSPQREIKKESLEKNNDPFEFDFDFGEVFEMLEMTCKLEEAKLEVDKNGLIGVKFTKGGSGFVSPK